MTSFWALQAELRQQELLDDAQQRRVSSSPIRRRGARIFNLTLPRLRRNSNR